MNLFVFRLHTSWTNKIKWPTNSSTDQVAWFLLSLPYLSFTKIKVPKEYQGIKMAQSYYDHVTNVLMYFYMTLN